MENPRFKFRVWDKGNKRYQGTQDWQPYLDTDGDVCFINTDDVRNYPPENYFIIEQCTGLKDKNGNLIYEGDIVRCSDGNIYNICWSDSAMIMIAVNTTTKIGDAIYKLKRYDDLEIIGNVHEQAEQKN